MRFPKFILHGNDNVITIIDEINTHLSAVVDIYISMLQISHFEEEEDEYHLSAKVLASLVGTLFTAQTLTALLGELRYDGG